MALNFTVSYTFAPSTTISSSQVNTNTTDVAAVFQGLEAVTKSFARLQVDATPTVSADVAIKSYVDNYSKWRLPRLVWGSVTTVSIESGLDGTSGDIPMLFPDGSMRTETSTTRTTFDITRNAVLTDSGAQSGLTGATSEAANTWYALYAVKVTDSSTKWVTVGSTVIPTQGNFATLNTAYGTNGWVYLGEIANGDKNGATSDIVKFKMVGNRTIFTNVNAGNLLIGNGILMAGTAGAATNTWTYAAGTAIGSAQVPAHILAGTVTCGIAGVATGSCTIKDSGANFTYTQFYINNDSQTRISDFDITTGIAMTNSGAASRAQDIYLEGFIDGVLGVGSHPLL